MKESIKIGIPVILISIWALIPLNFILMKNTSLFIVWVISGFIIWVINEINLN